MNTKLGATFLFLLCQSSLGFEPTTNDDELLAKHGIQPTPASVATFLRQLKPNAALRQKARKLIEQLGDPVFSVREAAMAGLLELPEVPLSLLREAAKSEDQEIGYRAQAVLDDPRTKEKLRAAHNRREVVAVVLRLIRQKKIRTTAEVILQVAPFLKDRELEDGVADAVAGVAEPSDLPLLRRSISDESTAVRIAAIRGLGKAAGPAAKPELRALLRDDNSRVVLAAAHALAAQADRAAISVLIELLAATDEPVRVRSVQILRQMTKQNFAVNPYGKADDQQLQREHWKAWLAKDGGTAAVHALLELRPLPENLVTGLLAHYNFDDDAEGRLKDGSGNDRHATPQNAYALTSRGGGKALQLRGLGHHGDGGGHAILPFVEFSSHQQFTLALWVHESGMTHPEGEAYITFGTDRGVGTEDALGIAHFNENLTFRVGGGQISVPYPEADRGRWVHYAMTYKDRRLRAYRNGRLLGETVADVSVQSKRAALGRHWWGDGTGTSARFQGELDDIRVYNRALSQQQIEILINSAAAKPASSQ